MLPLQASPTYPIYESLQTKWHERLTPQDRQKLWPHITISNKTSPEEATSIHARAVSGFKPLVGLAIGLRLWRYRQGPWDSVRTFAFGAK
jgi:hypothetical protein